MPNRYDGAPPPAAPPVPTYQVLRAHKDGKLDVTVCADMIRSVVLHWVVGDVSGEGESRVCKQHEPEGCLYHDDPFSWAGFLPVFWRDKNKKAVLRLAPREADALAKALGVDLRWKGRRVRLTPVNAGGGRSVIVDVINPNLPPAEVGTFSIERTICLVLKTNRIPRQSAPPPDDPSGEGVIPCA